MDIKEDDVKNLISEMTKQRTKFLETLFNEMISMDKETKERFFKWINTEYLILRDKED